MLNTLNIPTTQQFKNYKQFHVDNLMVIGPPRGNFPYLTKTILVMSPRNVPQAEAFFRGYILQIVTGRRYLWGFMGSNAA